MAKFVYQMQNILQIKYKLEDQAKSVYAQARQKLSEEEKKLMILKDRKLDYEMKLKECISSKLNLLEIKKYENAIETIKVSINIQIINVNDAKLKLEQARIKLSEVMIDRKTHEKLREKAFDNFKLELELEERKEIDELVSFKYNTPNGSEDDA